MVKSNQILGLALNSMESSSFEGGRDSNDSFEGKFSYIEYGTRSSSNSTFFFFFFLLRKK